MFKSVKTLLLTFAVFRVKNTDQSRLILLHNRTLGIPRDISCYNSLIKNDFPVANERFPTKSIFFVETSCKGGLDSRQACAVESAARAHSLWQINVLFTGPISTDCLETTALSALRRYNNVHFYRVHFSELLKNNHLERLEKQLKSSRVKVFHAADILRYLVLYKWSGVYLDLDVVVMRPFDGLAENWAGRTYGVNRHALVGASAMRLSRNFVGRGIAAAAVRYIRDHFNPEQRADFSADVITNVLKQHCSTTNLTEMNAYTCEGFQVYNHRVFYPFSWSNAHALLSTGIPLGNMTHVVHAWASTTYRQPVPPGSLYSTLAQIYCPTTYGLYERSFGTNVNNVL